MPRSESGVSGLLWRAVSKAVNSCWEGGPLAYDLVNNIGLVTGMLQMLCAFEDDRWNSYTSEVERHQEYFFVCDVKSLPAAAGQTWWWRYRLQDAVVRGGLLYLCG